MSQERMGGGDVVKFAAYLERKAIRDAERKLNPKQEAPRAEIPPLEGKQLLDEARVIVARFPSIRLLAQDIDRQRRKLAEKIVDLERRKRAEIPCTDNLERARADYLNEYKQATQLEEKKLEGVIKNMFAGYNEEQTVFLNSKYVAYARAYLEMVDSKHKLPDMEKRV